MAVTCNCLVEEELPLKQGLKHLYDSPNSQSSIVEEELPLKQGLKLASNLRGASKSA